MTISVRHLALLAAFSAGCSPHQFDFVAVVETRLPGAATSEVESTVTVPIEEAFRSVEGVAEMTSESRPESSRIEVRMVGRAWPAVARARLQQRLWDIERSLPAGSRWVVRQPELNTMLFVRDVDGKADEAALAAMAQGMAERIRRVPGVFSADVLGPPPVVRRVRLDSERIATANLATSDVLQAIRKRGAFTFPARDLGLVPLGKGASLSDFVEISEGSGDPRAVVMGGGRTDFAAVSVRSRVWIQDDFWQAVSGPPLPVGGEFSVCGEGTRLQAVAGASLEATVWATLGTLPEPARFVVQAGDPPIVDVCTGWELDPEKSAIRKAGGLRRSPARGSSRVRISVSGTDANVAEMHAMRLAMALEEAEEVVAVEVLPRRVTRELLAIDRVRATRAGVDVRALLDVKETALESGLPVGVTPDGLSVSVQTSGLAGLTVRARNGEIHSLDAFVFPLRGDELQVIRKRDGVREWTVIVEQAAIRQIDRVIARNPPPPGCLVQRLDPVEPSRPTTELDQVVLYSLLVTAAAGAITAWNERRRRALRIFLGELAKLRAKASIA